MANDVEEFIQRHELKMPIIIGHSMLVVHGYPRHGFDS